MHICLQSGSEDILLKMRRMYKPKEFEEIALQLKTDYPNFNLTTDIIVGFPGETENDFSQTLDLTKKIGFGHVHTFKYSVRKGTRAERMPDHISEKEKSRRSEILRNIVDETKLKYRKSFIGQNQRVLVETYNKQGFAKGFGEHYIPILIKAPDLKKNNFYNIIITDIEIGDEPVLIGDII